MKERYFVDHIHPTLRGRPDAIATHNGTNDIANDDCSSLQINLIKICELVTELSLSTKILLSSIILRPDKSNINVKVNHGNEIIEQFRKTNKSRFDRQLKHKGRRKLYVEKKLHLNDAGKSLLANDFIKYFINM